MTANVALAPGRGGYTNDRNGSGTQTITTAAVSTPYCLGSPWRFRRVPPKRAHQPADHVGGRENDDGAKRDGYRRDEPRLRGLSGNTVHCRVLYLFTVGRIEGHRQQPVLCFDLGGPGSNGVEDEPASPLRQRYHSDRAAMRIGPLCAGLRSGFGQHLRASPQQAVQPGDRGRQEDR